MTTISQAFDETEINEPELREYAEVMFYRGAMAAVKILGEASGNGDPIAVSRKACELVDELEEYFKEPKE